jgi:hypothetical protein
MIELAVCAHGVALVARALAHGERHWPRAASVGEQPAHIWWWERAKKLGGRVRVREQLIVAEAIYELI